MTAGAWLVDKPAGPTSHDIVAAVRRQLGRGAKVGHAGTLDPFATGLLLVLTGRATRLAQYLSGLDKTYEVTVRLGATSASGDPEGPIHETGASPPPHEEVASVLPGFLGRQEQRVPALAAVKVGGEPLYRKTRRGEAVAAPTREVEIHAIELRGYDPQRAECRLEVRCGKGTYMRELAEDLGERLGCGGYCAELRRTAIGALRIENAVPPDAVDTGPGIGLRAALGALEQRELTSDEAAGVVHGRALDGDAAGPVALVADGRVIAVAHADGRGHLRPRVVLEPRNGGDASE